jgi:hypothetical protein
VSASASFSRRWPISARLDEQGRIEARALARRLIGAPEQAQLFIDGTRQLTVPVQLKGIRIGRSRPFGDVYLDLSKRCGELFAVQSEVMLYDVTSTYFEGQAEANLREQRGYSRDHRPDCKQVWVTLVVTFDGFPLGFEVFAGRRSRLSDLTDDRSHDGRTPWHSYKRIKDSTTETSHVGQFPSRRCIQQAARRSEYPFYWI